MNPFKLYRRSQQAQYRWIRKHPIQWIALNAIIIAGFIAYTEYKRPTFGEKFEHVYDTLDD